MGDMTSIRALVLASATLAAGLACNSNPRVTPSSSGGSTGGTSGGGGPQGGVGGSAVGTPGFTLPDATAAAPPDAEPGPVAYPGGITRPCANLECRQTTCVMGDCKQPTCGAGQRTTLRGRVYDPAGKLPLYNVVLYVPNEPLAPIATGPSCDRCDSPVSGKPITSALTDTKGDFLLDNVPAGADIPLVIQVGKWRREITLPPINACTTNAIDDPNLLRLPRNQQEGNIPRIALTTGGADRLECLMRKIGVDASEFTPDTGPGRINFYAGRAGGGNLATSAYAAGGVFPAAAMFWNQPGNFMKYDIVILSCEGNWNLQDKSDVAKQGLMDYVNKGGRVFASHWHNAWIQLGPPPWNTVASFVPGEMGFGGQLRMNALPNLPDGFTTEIDTSFPKGEAMADWLVNVQASPMRGQLPINEGKHTAFTVDPTKGQRWIHSNAIPVQGNNTMAGGVQYFSFNAPVGEPADRQCGRTVFTDIHVSAGDQAGPPFPMGCVTPDLSPQEKALVFMLFDLSSCIQPDQERPRPPIIP
jgi:hypothetical protein